MMQKEKSIEKKSVVAVSPEQIVFEEVIPGVVYEQKLIVRNVTTKSACRVRVDPPAATGPFRLVYEPSKAIAPGLEVWMSIEFILPQNGNRGVLDAQLQTGTYRDRIQVKLSTGETIEIPLIAHEPQPKVVFSRSGVLNLGEIALGSTVNGTISLQNQGPVSAQFALEWNCHDTPLRFIPAAGSLGADPNSFKALQTRVEPLGLSQQEMTQLENRADMNQPSGCILDFSLGPNNIPGPLIAHIRTNIKNQSQSPLLELAATVVPGNLSLYADTEKVNKMNDTLSFGSIFYGQSREHTALLVNNSPVSVPFVISATLDKELTLDHHQRLAAETQKISGSEEEDDDNPLSSTLPASQDNWFTDDGAVTISPLEGLLEPYASQPLIIRFAPSAPPLASNFKHQLDSDTVSMVRPYGHRIKISAQRLSSPQQRENSSRPSTANTTKASSNMTPENIELSLIGAAAPSSAISISPRTLRFGTCDIGSKQKALVTITNASSVPARYKFAKVAQYSVKPQCGLISGNATTTVVVTYKPGQIGSFDTKCEFSVENSLTTMILRLIGKAVMPTRETSEFHNSRYVDARGGDKYSPEELLPAYSSWLGSASPCQKASKLVFDYEEQHRMEMLREREVREMNRTKYIQFLRDSRKQRELSYVEATQAARAQYLKRHRSDPTGVDLGMDAPLDEPKMLPLPPALEKEPLWLARRSRRGPGGGSSGGANGNPFAGVDPEHIAVEKFKARPTTQAEMRSCEMRLSAAELAQIITSHSTLDFGRVCVGSQITKTLAIFNGLPQTTLVAVNTMALPAEIAAEENNNVSTQAIPSDGIAGFDFNFNCQRELNEYKSIVQLTINDRHVIKVDITAQVVPVELNLSSTDINLEFSEESLEDHVDETITVANPGNSDVEFSWTPVSPFVIAPEQGIIPAYGSLEATITWTPTAGSRNNAKLRMHVSGAKSDQILSVSGKVEDGKCAFTGESSKRADFGTIAVGTEREIVISIQNCGTGLSVCSIELPSDAGDFLYASELCFAIPVGGTRNVTLTFKPRTARNLEGLVLCCGVRGAKSIKLPIVGAAIIPEIKVSGEISSPARSDYDQVIAPVFDMASQFVGFETRRQVILENESHIVAMLQLDMRNQSEFSVEPCQIDTQALGVSRSSMDTAPVDATSITSDEGSVTMMEPADIEGVALGQRADLWTIRIAPKSQISFELVFAPANPGKYEFDIPLDLCVGYKRDWGKVHGVALPPMLVVSSTRLDFGERILVSDSTRQLPVIQELVLTNQHGEKIDWKLDECKTDNSIISPMGDSTDTMSSPCAPLGSTFYVAPRLGTLQPGESTKVRVTFAPTRASEFEERFSLNFKSVYANDEEGKEQLIEKPDLLVHFCGIGINPKLELLDREHSDYLLSNGDILVLPTVPLGIKSRARFWVRNVGFEQVQLKCRLPPHIPVKLDVEFPEGRLLDATTPTISVVLTFCSDSPVSFASTLQLIDTDANVYSISIAGAADNCILSSYAFVDEYRNEYFYHHQNDGSPPRLIEASHARQLVNTSDNNQNEIVGPSCEDKENSKFKTDMNKDLTTMCATAATAKNLAPDMSGVDPNKTRPLPTDDIAPLIVLWLNYHALNSQKGADAPMRVIPDDIVAAHGKPALDAIEALAGRKIPGRLRKLSQHTTSKELLSHLLVQYNALLLFLRERGALLNSIQPEQLLSCRHYIKVRSQQAEAATSTATKQARLAIWESTHGDLCREAWITVLLQSIRIFSLTRITPKSFASLPGVLKPAIRSHQQGQNDASHAGSNVYSSAECILLKWLGYHIANGALVRGTTSFAKQMQAFDEAFQDGRPLCYLLRSHVPTLANSGGPLEGCTAGSEAVNLSQENKVAFAEKAYSALEALRSNLYSCLDDGGEKMMSGSLTNPSELLSLQGVRAMLFALHLYLTLPNFVPKTTIEFNATLGEPMCKMIELQNSSHREIKYEVVMEGSSDFQPRTVGTKKQAAAKGDRSKVESTKDRSSIVVDAKSSRAYAVELVPRFSSPVEARLTFFSVPGSYPGLRTPSMVFVVKSCVEKSIPVSVIEVECTAYELKMINVDIQNPFAESGPFCISMTNVLEEEFVFKQKRHGKRSSSQQQQRRNRTSPALEDSILTAPQQNGLLLDSGESSIQGEEKVARKLLGDAFFTSQTNIRFDSQGLMALPVQLLAITPGIYKAEIRLLNEEIGEFVVELRARISMPKSLESLKFSMEMQSENQRASAVKLLRIPTLNPLLERALAALSERIPSITERAAVRSALNRLARGAMTAGSNKSPDLDASVSGSRFEIFINSPFFQCPDELRLDSDTTSKSNSNKKIELVDLSDEITLDGLPINFFPQKAGTYTCTVVSRAIQGLVQDIRVIQLEAVVLTPKVQTVLEFRAPARRTITQELPIINNTDEDWNFTAQLSGSRVFSGPNKIRVPQQDRALYPLTFAPTWVSRDQGKLTLRNLRSNEIFEYSLNGEGEPPLAEGHKVIQCNARETITQSFKLTNDCKGPKTYIVESDLPFPCSGPSEIIVPPLNSATYQMKFTPTMGGSFTGSVTFTQASNGEYVWYTVEVQVDSPLEESVIDISTVVRKAASVRISLANPLSETVDFDVMLQGEGLVGESKFTLQGGDQAGTYELFYSPLIAQTHTGAIAFLNERVGEFWYSLNLTAVAAEPERIDEMVCAVGRETSQTILIENPLDHEITMKGSCTNDLNFAVETNTKIPPYGSAPVKVQYAPSDIEVEQICEVILEHPALGKVKYVATGRGTEPDRMPEQVPSALVGEPSSYMFSFRNPFATPLEIDVQLKKNNFSEAQGEALSLLMRKTVGIILGKYASISIPLSFNPAVIEEHCATVDISGHYNGRNLVWSYPIRGLVNAPLQRRYMTINAKAKTSTRSRVELKLASLAELASEGESFTFEIINAESDVSSLVDQALSVTPIHTHLTSANDSLLFEFCFDPPKPFNTSVHLVIKGKTGGRWPFEMILQATQPDPDDVIAIESNLNHTATVSFNLKNNTMNFTPFSAYFATGSSDTFTVAPANGVLSPASSSGTTFKVRFAPLKYGMMQRGRLVVETDTMMWSYAVTGTHPTFTVPNPSPKVDSHLSKKYLPQSRS